MDRFRYQLTCSVSEMLRHAEVRPGRGGEEQAPSVRIPDSRGSSREPQRLDLPRSQECQDAPSPAQPNTILTGFDTKDCTIDSQALAFGVQADPVRIRAVVAISVQEQIEAVVAFSPDRILPKGRVEKRVAVSSSLQFFPDRCCSGYRHCKTAYRPFEPASIVGHLISPHTALRRWRTGEQGPQCRRSFAVRFRWPAGA